MNLIIRRFSVASKWRSSSPVLVSSVSDVLRKITERDVTIIEDFISATEEENILSELEPALSRQKFMVSHWDKAIANFRETEKTRWRSVNLRVIERLREVTKQAIGKECKTIGPIHVLDLASNGYINSHVDSIKFCGPIITILSLLSPAVLRLSVPEPSEVKHSPWMTYNPHEFGSLPEVGAFIDVLVPKCSTYILRGQARYELAHAILARDDKSTQIRVPDRDRRISVICRADVS